MTVAASLKVMVFVPVAVPRRACWAAAIVALTSVARLIASTWATVAPLMFVPVVVITSTSVPELPSAKVPVTVVCAPVRTVSAWLAAPVTFWAPVPMVKSLPERSTMA